MCIGVPFLLGGSPVVAVLRLFRHVERQCALLSRSYGFMFLLLLM
ncbi:hypothetical protein HMPREF1991_02094 [Hoylesella loescheii DSM 19665 = JCM 12249 = ATCC 15930]|uniref:Uncharacterized protein n=1 Tax=Hoylesella loescheii DSM 19665 = JCM 12249 = ATCC 15930 TaxID=1122985 RepID=A0A069QIE4_HOYLO|nr:hypothetical protein HMPREF1991_02094 [Hoylesella loescheii DSM 19665 = JCM 12249 = ATCC 15930]